MSLSRLKTVVGSATTAVLMMIWYSISRSRLYNKLQVRPTLQLFSHAHIATMYESEPLLRYISNSTLLISVYDSFCSVVSTQQDV